ncbi:MAG: aspartyl protease family protein [Candidatus Eisenbacteria bacterium]|uniref:Aspartyl protease family protein n=1 Tax=Eiseniibacteriota bacterium TaxID=2212470 RepID=A0A933SG78_UNCEI|nr:aspartyl protease family protein [Candidatus Eisenbacteria bacterium]
MTTRHGMRLAALTLAGALALGLAGAARAEWMQPDPTWREAQQALRDAARDTAGHAADPARLAALGAVQLRLLKFADAEKSLTRVLELQPGNATALAGLGKLASFRGRDAQADSMLVLAGDFEGAVRDRYDLAVRREDWKGALALAGKLEDEAGRVAQLEALAETPAAEIEHAGDGVAIVNFERAWPVPLVKAKLNGQAVLMAVDLGATEMLIDPSAARLCRVSSPEGERSIVWMGGRLSARNGVLASVTLGGVTVRNLPAAITSLRKYSLSVNPQGVPIAGVIGLPMLRRLGFTMDYRQNRLEIGKSTPPAPAGAVRVPFEMWGVGEMVVYGSVNGGRKTALQVGTGLPDAGIGGAAEMFEEFGMKPGKLANAVRSIGAMLQGRPWSRVTAPTVALGSVVADKVPGWSGVVDVQEFWRHGVRRDGLLGPAFFRDRRVSVDWEKRELVFAPRR